MPFVQPRHVLAAVVLYALFNAKVDPTVIAMVAGILYLDERRASAPPAVPGPPAPPALPGP